jgi:hypothetical protein
MTTPYEVVSCPNCGHINAKWRANCENCFGSLSATLPEFSAAIPIPQGRPGFVTVYILLSIAAIPLILDAGFNTPPYHHSVVYMCLALAGTIYNLIVSWGLWRMQNWARILALSGNCLVMILGILNLFAVSNPAFPGNLVGSALVVLGIGTFIIYWFATNGKYFD